MIEKKIGLLLGDEEDWPSAFELLLSRLGPTIRYRRKTYKLTCERIRIHPFGLHSSTPYHVVIDRLAYWHFNPREWLKKAALVNGVYMLNNPFTFQSMEKHSAYCAMIRLGLNVPQTWLIPAKVGPPTEKYRRTSAKYHDFFDLSAIAREIGYPLFMKPFDGGGWRDVSRISDEDDLLRSYDASGQTLMHIQTGLEDYDVFVRTLAIGPQALSLNYDPSQPMHGRYVIDHQFLSPETGREARITVKLVNSLFRWDFNSCECILKNGILWLIDFANACPDIALTSLHYYFPWAIKALVAWSIFSAITGRKMRISMDLDRYFRIADSGLSADEKLMEFERIADKHFESERFWEFRETVLPNIDEAMWELVQTPEFDGVLVDTVRSLFPAHEHDQFIDHYRGILDLWVKEEAK